MIFKIDSRPESSPALICDDSTVLSYGDLVREVSGFKRAIKGRRLIFCLCRNDAAPVIGYLGTLEQGSVMLLLAEEPDPDFLSGLIERYSPSYLWRPVKESEHEAALYRALGYGLFETGLESPEMDAELSLLLSSSGTTGSPKLIKLSKKNLESNAASIAEYLELDENERPLTVLPMQYTFGLSVINSHLYAGAAILMTRSGIVSQDFWNFLSDNSGTSISGVPYTYEILRRIRFMERDDTGSLRSMIQAGGHLPAELQEIYGRWCSDRGIKFFIMYGQTEATARMSYLPPEDLLRKTGSIGIAIPGGRFEIIDENGNIITRPGETGELVYYGPNVSLGYASCGADLRIPDERKGRLVTGDLASFDSEGYYYIRGRLSRFIKLYGVRVSLDECENILKGLDVDAEFACTGDDRQLVVFTDSKRCEEIPGYLSGRLKLNIRSFRSVFLERIPTKESGKPDYSALKKLI